MGFTSLWTWLTQNAFTLSLILIAISLTTWLVMATVLLQRASSLIFAPQESHQMQVDVPYQQLWLTNKNNQKIDAIWIENLHAKQVVLYLHGNRGRLSHFFPPLHTQYKIFAPAYPGYHNSEGVPTPEGAYETALLAYDYLIEQGYQEQEIILLGHSLGGCPAVYTAAQRPAVSKLVLVNTLHSMFDLCYPKWGIRCIFARPLFNSGKYAPLVSTKVRVFHAPHDDIIPYAQGQKLFTKFIGTHDKKFITLPENCAHSEFDVLEVIKTE